MTINYLGHSCFKLKGKNATVITDPYDEYVGFALPTQRADLITVSHNHKDHSAISRVKGTDQRPEPFVISGPGEYEVQGVSVFGIETDHDKNGGVQRGKNTVYNIIIDGVKICHLGDLGHLLTQEQANDIGMVDVLLMPVGGVFTIGPEEAMKVARFLEPSFVIPMHFKTANHDPKVFGDIASLEDFLKQQDSAPKLEKKLRRRI